MTPRQVANNWTEWDEYYCAADVAQYGIEEAARRWAAAAQREDFQGAAAMDAAELVTAMESAWVSIASHRRMK